VWSEDGKEVIERLTIIPSSCWVTSCTQDDVKLVSERPEVSMVINA